MGHPGPGSRHDRQAGRVGTATAQGPVLEEPWSSLLALALARLENGAFRQAGAAFSEIGTLRPDISEAWAGAAVAAHLAGDHQSAQTFRNMLEASCPPRVLLGWVETMMSLR